ncbi:MAG: SusC/RagA family TonB-linked outer membrane protein [Adhaeribacter sp.]
MKKPLLQQFFRSKYGPQMCLLAALLLGQEAAQAQLRRSASPQPLSLAQAAPRNPQARQALVKKEVRGTVSDATGPLPGVAVTLKSNPSQGVTTDLSGKFILDVPDESAVLVFRMVGFETQQVPVSGREVINLVMKPSSSQLEEIVVTAFGQKQTKQEVVGAVTTINPAELKVPSSNLTTALAGRAAGVIAYQRSGEPGLDNADFFIRGVTTFGYKMDPLILIDGIELTTTDLARLNPDDIASFSIMKDATSTALYGARGANGVILVTTKQGKEGKAKVNFRLENSFSAPTQNVELADPITYMKLHSEAVLTRDPLGEGLMYNEEKIAKTRAGVNPYMYPATDWRRQLIRDHTLNQRVNMNISGGGAIARYYVAGSFNQDNGLLKVDRQNNFNNNIDLKTYTLRSNVNVNLTKSTEMIVRLSGSFDDYTGPIGGGTATFRNVMRSNPVLFPAYYPKDEAHQFSNHVLFGNYSTGSTGRFYLNPYADMVKGYKDYSRSTMLAQFELKQDLSALTEGLAFRTMLNTTRNAYFDVSRFYDPFFYQAGSYDKLANTYHLTELNTEDATEYLGYREGEPRINSIFYLESALNYNKGFGKHNLSGMAIYIMRQNLAANMGSLQSSLPSRNLGLSGRATYAYDNRYFAEFNFGYNGSERFHEKNRFGFFPSAGLAWSVSNEKFFAGIKPTITNLRLRGTYGLIGQDAIGSATDRFFYLSQVDMNNAARGAVFGTDNTYSRTGVDVTRYSNPDITWETSVKSNVALELGLFDKFNFIGEYFREYRRNILMTRASIPTTMGLSAAMRANVGEASGEGVDLSLDYMESFSSNFWIQARANFTYATSAYQVYEEPQYNEAYLSRVGYPTTQQWGYIAERLFVDDAEVANSPAQNFGSVVRGGDIKYRDVNGDGQITTLDRVPLGFPTTPEIIYGFGASLGRGPVDISAFFQGLGRESFWIDVNATAPFVSYTYPNEVFTGDYTNPILENQLIQAYADNHWSEENRNLYALWPRLSATRNENNSQQSSWFMRDGSFVRLKSAEIGYTLPQPLATRLRMQKLRLYLSGTNLLTWSRFKLWDVEMAGNGLGYPVQRVVNLGLNVSF